MTYLAADESSGELFGFIFILALPSSPFFPKLEASGYRIKLMAST